MAKTVQWKPPIGQETRESVTKSTQWPTESNKFSPWQLFSHLYKSLNRSDHFERSWRGNKFKFKSTAGNCELWHRASANDQETYMLYIHPLLYLLLYSVIQSHPTFCNYHCTTMRSGVIISSANSSDVNAIFNILPEAVFSFIASGIYYTLCKTMILWIQYRGLNLNK